MKSLMMVVAFACLLGAVDAKDDKATLQGRWQAVSSDQGGQDDPNAKQHSITFEKDTIVINRGDQVFVKGTFKLDGTKSPRQIDITIEEGPDQAKGKTALGVYELKDDTLKWATNHPGETERPTGFGSTAGTSHMMVTLKKEKK